MSTVSDSSRVLYVAAKAPRCGLAKTRLARGIGEAHATTLYRAFLCDLAARFASAPFPVGWYVTPPDAWDDLGPLVGHAERSTRVIPQGPGDWTTRQRALFRDASARGEERTVLVASDSPHLAVETVAAAFRLLDRHDVVLGPTVDGGYYLIGMRGWHDVMRGVAMSTGTVLEEILFQSRRQQVSVAQVPATFDVDEASDLEALLELASTRADLPATRTVLATLGLLTNVRFRPNERQASAA